MNHVLFPQIDITFLLLFLALSFPFSSGYILHIFHPGTTHKAQVVYYGHIKP